MRSGYINLDGGHIITAGSNTHIWSSLARSTFWDGSKKPSAQYLGVFTDEVATSATGSRWATLPLRGLAAKGDATITIIWTIGGINADISMHEKT